MFTNDLIPSRSPFWGYVNSIIGLPIYGSLRAVACAYSSPARIVTAPQPAPEIYYHRGLRWTPRRMSPGKNRFSSRKMVHPSEHRALFECESSRHRRQRRAGLLWWYDFMLFLSCLYSLGGCCWRFPGERTRAHKGHTAPLPLGIARARFFMVYSIEYYCYCYF